MTPLRHRLAALAFPSGPRRAELIGTLADAEEEGGRAPGLREAVNILRHGLRARLGRPKSRIVVPYALFIALLGGIAGGAGMTALAWKTVPPLPTGEQAAEISGTVFPGKHVYGGGLAPDITHELDAEGGLINGWQEYEVSHDDDTRDVPAYTAAVRERLTAAGWAVHETDSSDTMKYMTLPPDFWAVSDGLVLAFTISYLPDPPPYAGDGIAMFSLTRETPDRLWWASLPAAAAGAVTAFLIFGWASRRTGSGSGVMSLFTLIHGFSLLLLMPFTYQALALWWWPGPSEPRITPFWQPLFYDFVALLTAWAVLLSVIGLLLAALHRPWPLAGLRRFLARSPWRWGTALAAVAVAGAVLVWQPDPPPAPCDPDGVPDDPPTAAQAGLSTDGRVFVAANSTQDQRNLIQAAIGRSNASPMWHGTAESAPGCGAITPFFDVSYSTPAGFDLLEAEVSVMPGVVAVQRVA